MGLGRGVVSAVVASQGLAYPGCRLHVPSYFCGEVIASLRLAGVEVALYEDEPRWGEPRWSSLRPVAGDLVLAVNYFGVRDGATWEGWEGRYPGVVLIEDHTHDPVSRWAAESKAGYAFASLRKTMPVSDGAILWSPQGRALPGVPAYGGELGGVLKTAAMYLKSEYLAGQEEDAEMKRVYRFLFAEGEKRYFPGSGLGISPWSLRMLGDGFPAEWRRKREENVRRFIAGLEGWSEGEALFTEWPAGHCPFNGVVLCRTAEERDRLRTKLIGARVYPAVHWEVEASELSARILTIPLDHRYGREDVDRVLSVMKTA